MSTVPSACSPRCRPAPRTWSTACSVPDSVAADAHKWLNVPYESGFAFVRDPRALTDAFGSWNAPYLASVDDRQID